MRFVYILCFLPFCLSAQDQQPLGQEGTFTFDTDTPFKLLELDEKVDEPIVVPKKKPKKKVFFGIKTRKRFASDGYGSKKVLELFYVLKRHDMPKGFVRDCYWYDFKRKSVRKTTLQAFDPKKGALLHGPYTKTAGDITLEEGIFYKGLKHGRWMKTNRDDLLVDKEKYYKGWPKESLVTYYNPDEKTKLKEVIPIEYGEKEGYYYLLHENGTIAVMGEYQWGQKVGEWKESYTSGKRKKIIAYPKDPFDKNWIPYVQSEWDERGQLLYKKK